MKCDLATTKHWSAVLPTFRAVFSSEPSPQAIALGLDNFVDAFPAIFASGTVVVLAGVHASHPKLGSPIWNGPSELSTPGGVLQTVDTAAEPEE